MGIYSNTQGLIDQTVKNIAEYRTLIGETTKASDGRELGLNMINEANTLKAYEESLSRGIFQVMFTGGFSAGKSAMLNALMSKHLLRSSANAETAVLTRIVFNAPEKVIVYKKKIDKNGAPVTEEYRDIKAFFDKYRVDQDRPDMFDDVDFVQIQQSQDGIGGSLVQLIDSPGVGNSKQDDQVARSFAEKANAIVYMVSAAKPWEYDDKEYIHEHYDNKEMSNVFFVINKMDLVNTVEEVEELKKNTRIVLKNVFTGRNGSFNEKLFNERVFYTTAQDSLFLRAGIPSNLLKKPSLPESDEETHVPEFERALGAFLTDGDRDKSAIASYIPTMAKIYVSAEKTVEAKLKKLSGNIDELKAEQANNEQTVRRTSQIISNIEESGKSAARRIVEGINRAYDNYISDVDAGWDEYFENANVKFSTLDLLKLAVTRDEEKKKAGIKPIIYAKKLDDYGTRGKRELINRYAAQLDRHLNKLLDICGKYGK